MTAVNRRAAVRATSAATARAGKPAEVLTRAWFPLTAIATCLLATAAQAQGTSGTVPAAPSESGNAVQLEEIIVTATKRGDATVQDVPIALQAFSGEDLASQGAMDFQDFYRQVPGLSVQDEGPGDKRYVIRGINSTGAGTIGLYLDEVIITGENAQDGSGQQPDVKLFDLERVEVLKGPQGTTFGSSSMAGAIRYITAKPDLNSWSGKLNTSLRSTEGAELGSQVDGAVNLPLIQDTFAVRIAGFHADLPGYVDNRFDDGVNGERSKAGRVSALWKINEDLRLSAMAMSQSTDQDSKSYFHKEDFAGNPIGGDGYTQADVAKAPWEEEIDLYNATLEYLQPYGTFTATASRFERNHVYTRDASLAAQAYFGLPFDEAGRSALVQPKQRELDSYEMRFASNFDGPMQLLAGYFSQTENRFYRSYWPTVNELGVPYEGSRNLLDRTVDTEIEEQALFGEVSYDVTDALTATVGARWYDFKLTEQSASITRAGGAPGTGTGPVLNASDDGIIGRFNLAYRFNPSINTYLQVAQGFRAGGTNDQTAAELAGVVVPEGYGSDTLWNYELGLKTEWLDRKLQVNAAAYYIDWSDIQVKSQATSGTVSFPYTGNGGGADVTGLELDVHAEPIAGLTLGWVANYNVAELTKDNPAPSTGDKGDRIPYVPEFTTTATVDYRFPIAGTELLGVVGGEYAYTGDRATEINARTPNYYKLDAFSLFGLRAGIESDRWSVTLLGNNLFNDDTVINYNEVVPGVYPEGYYINRPRTVSLVVSTSF